MPVPTGDPFADAPAASPSSAPKAGPVGDPFAGNSAPVGNPFEGAENVGKGLAQGGIDATRAMHDFVLYGAQHALSGAIDVLGAPQRAVGETIRQAERAHAGQGFDAGAIGESVFHPSDEVNARTTESIRALIHAPTDDAIAKWVGGIHGLTDTEKGWMTTAAQAAQHFGEQTISDPLTLAEGLGVLARVTGLGLRAAKTADAMYRAAKVVHPAFGKAFDHLLGTSEQFAQGSAVTQRAARAIRNNGIRGDLDDVFTADGKRMRLAIENKWYGRIGQAYPDMAEAAADDDRARDLFLSFKHRTGSSEDQRVLEGMGVRPGNANPPFIKDRFDQQAVEQAVRAQIIRRTGKVPSAAEIAAAVAARRTAFIANRTRSLKAELAGFMAGTPEERLAQLNSQRASLRDLAINNETAALARRDPSILQSGNAAVTDFDKLATADPHVKLLNEDEGFGKVLKMTRDLSQRSVSAVPWIHELRNVGELASGAGGLHMIPAMFAKILKNSIGTGKVAGASADELARLDRIGALPGFFHDGAPGFKQLTDTMQAMDIGYRAALLKTLDKVSGDSREMAKWKVGREFKAAGKQASGPEFDRAVQTRFVQNELLKGRSISERIGDPRNQDKIVRLFQAFGGWYPAFRLGIAPRNMLASLLEHPARVTAITRAKSDIQDQQRANSDGAFEYQMGGPGADSAELGFNLAAFPFSHKPDYLLSPATSGVIGGLLSGAGGDAGTPPWETAMRLGAGLVPGAYTARDFYEAATGQSADEPQELRDRFIMHFFNFFLGNYDKKVQSPYVDQMIQRRHDKEYPQL